MASQIRISSADILESDTGTELVFTVSLDQPDSGESITVEFSTVEDTAEAGSDFTVPTNKLITFAPNETSQLVKIPIVGDKVYERTENFFVKLVNPSANATIDPARAEAVGTIRNDDPLPTLSIDDVEFSEDKANAVLTVTRAGDTTEIITVDYSTVEGTAKIGADYTTTLGKLIFLANETTKQITVPILEDVLSEASEKFTVKLSGVKNATLIKADGNVTVTDNDPLPSLSIGNVTIEETTGGANAVFTVTLSAASGQPITVKYATADQTAIAGQDYTASTGNLTFEPGVATQEIKVPILDDLKFETEETFLLNLSEAVGANIGQPQGTATITDSDPEATVLITIGDATITEGNSGTTIARFTVSLSAASTREINVNYALAHSTTNDNDVVLAPGTLKFTAGQTEQTIEVTVNGDTSDEGDESFSVNLASPTNAEILDGQGTGTITDDDGIPTISINTISLKEGNSGTTAVFTVSLSHATTETVEVDFDTSDQTATEADGDYSASSGKLTFNPGEALTQQIEITVNGDQVFEPNETFLVTLSNVVGAKLGTAQGQATLENDDAPPALPKISISDVRRITEGDNGTTTATFFVSLSSASNQPITVDYTIADGTAKAANNDYVSGQGKLTFAPGEIRQSITVTINGDTDIEPNETILVNLSNATNAEIARAQATGTIINDDRPPSISIGDITLKEGDNGTTSAVFQVTLDKAYSLPVTVDYTTLDETATTIDNEYVATSGKLTFNPGQTSQTVTVVVNGDTQPESDETFLVELSNATNGTIVDDRAVATIQNDDDISTTPGNLPTLSINDVSLQEGSSGTTTATFTLSLKGESSQSVTVNYATADDTATVADADYTAESSGSVTFAAGETTKTLTITINGDTKYESDETFRVNLTNAQNATIADNSGTATLVNDDTLATQPSNPDGGTESPGNVPILTGTPNADNLTGGDANVTIYGLGGDDVLRGGTGNDFIDGGDGNDTLYGSLGVDLLSGKEGGDRLLGGDGDDVIYGGKGNDQLYGENGNDILYGKKGTDLLSGGDGDDLLVGNLDADRLLGGTGKDRFGFRKLQDKVDRITDFSVQDDTILVARIAFKAGLKLGTIDAKQFQIGKEANGSSDRFIYNQSTGALFFDKDGSGDIAQLQIAQLSKKLAFTYRDIVVVADL